MTCFAFIQCSIVYHCKEVYISLLYKNYFTYIQTNIGESFLFLQKKYLNKHIQGLTLLYRQYNQLLHKQILCYNIRNSISYCKSKLYKNKNSRISYCKSKIYNIYCCIYITPCTVLSHYVFSYCKHKYNSVVYYIRQFIYAIYTFVELCLELTVYSF